MSGRVEIMVVGLSQSMLPQARKLSLRQDRWRFKNHSVHIMYSGVKLNWAQRHMVKTHKFGQTLPVQSTWF